MKECCCCCCCWVTSVVSDSVRPHRWQPTRLPCPWDSPGKNTGVGECLWIDELWTSAFTEQEMYGLLKVRLPMETEAPLKGRPLTSNKCFAQWIWNSLWEIGGSHKRVGLNKIIFLGSCYWRFISFMSLFDRLLLSCFPPGICHRNFYDLFWDSFKNLSIHLNRTLMFVNYLTIVDYL